MKIFQYHQSGTHFLTEGKVEVRKKFNRTTRMRQMKTIWRKNKNLQKLET